MQMQASLMLKRHQWQSTGLLFLLFLNIEDDWEMQQPFDNLEENLRIKADGLRIAGHENRESECATMTARLLQATHQPWSATSACFIITCK